MSKKIIWMVAGILAVIGALNWGFIGAFNFNLVEFLLGSGTILSRLVYILVGLSAIVLIVFTLMKMKNQDMKKD